MLYGAVNVFVPLAMADVIPLTGNHHEKSERKENGSRHFISYFSHNLPNLLVKRDIGSTFILKVLRVNIGIHCSDPHISRMSVQ